MHKQQQQTQQIWTWPVELLRNEVIKYAILILLCAIVWNRAKKKKREQEKPLEEIPPESVYAFLLYLLQLLLLLLHVWIVGSVCVCVWVDFLYIRARAEPPSLDNPWQSANHQLQ